MDQSLPTPRDRSATHRMRERLIASAIILVMAALFLLPSFYNGFPFVFPDTGGYLGAWGISGVPMRSPYYTIFNKIVDLHISPWPTILVQSLITAWILWLFNVSVFAVTGTLRLLLLSVFLTICTSLPWFVGWLMPDIFTPLMIISLTLLCFTPDMLPRGAKIILALLIATAVAVHQANLPVALWTLPALGLCALMGWRPSKAFLSGLLIIGLGLALGAAALAAPNLRHGRFGLSSGGAVFLLARLLEDGTALRYLEQACPRHSYAVCADLDELNSYDRLHPNSLSEHFLFGGPLEKLGGFVAEEPEATAIVYGTLEKYPVAQLRASAADAWHQLWRFATGAELAADPGDKWSSFGVRVVFGPRVFDNYLRSRQVEGVLNFDLIDSFHLIMLIISSIVVLGFLVTARGRQTWRPCHAAIFIAVLIVGNALTMGVLSGPYPRYQARVIWLVPLLAGGFLLMPASGRQSQSPG